MFHHQEHHRYVKETYGEKSLFEKSLDIYLGDASSSIDDDRGKVIEQCLFSNIYASGLKFQRFNQDKKMKN